MMPGTVKTKGGGGPWCWGFIDERGRFNQAWWLTPVIPVLSEAEVSGSPEGQELKTGLANMVKLRLYQKIQKN